MFRYTIIILLTVLCVSVGFCQTDVQLPNKSAGEFLAGEHYPLIYSGVGVIQGAAHPCTTAWRQIGYSPEADTDDNRNIGLFNPEVFTVRLKLTCSGSGDSASFSRAYFESAYDTTAKSFWNGDSSNVFIEGGTFSHPEYGIWRFEAVDDTSRGWLFPIRGMIGGYLRLVFESDIADTCTVNWSLICEH